MTYAQLGKMVHARVLLTEKGLATDLIQYYGRSWADIHDEVVRLQERLGTGTGSEVAQRFQLDRLLTIQEQIEQELTRYALYAEEQIIRTQVTAIARAGLDTEEMIFRQLGTPQGGVGVTFSRLPARATEHLVGNLANGRPLRTLFDGFGAQAGTEARQVIVSGLARGVNPREIASELRETMAIPLQRSLRIARTEVLRAYQEASQMTMAENSDVVEGWVWHAELGPQTCVMCCAMHGTYHTINESLNDHVSGRCVAVPRTKSWEEMGFSGIPDTRPVIERGDEWFAGQPEPVQRAILGQSAHDAYREGRVGIRDFVDLRRSETWGDMRVARSLRSALEQHGHINVHAGTYQLPK